ncbi:S phase cyclin A-associated protein in the endoplasmic reticulum isoform X2 [Ischnura elegans]|uniref:S phase cyclin A-associated protein in the endoplasmic reticulum isoform X2 n=1 Tax=Ischnura elegans TaxID=197161 RepID=UPI001ED8B981|nr:S phase cyclin A-associated protein in the endoplasmic reticulum isoform X2 [Ischnura elegans]
MIVNMTDSLRLKQSFRKTLAMEEVRLLVQEEGRAARNLIAFSVPVDQSQSETSKVSLKKPPTSPRGPVADGKKEENLRPTKRSSSLTKSRVRSASTGRDKKSELQARYWAFLFGNLQRAVDDIYQTCESDESITECKEVIMVLENYTRDFYNLIEWFKLKWDFENTPPPQRPTSLTWEIRKSSPGKAHTLSSFEKGVSSKHSVKIDGNTPDSCEGSLAARILSMHSPPLRSNPSKERSKVEETIKPGKCTSDTSEVSPEEMVELVSALSVLSEVDEAKKESCGKLDISKDHPTENLLMIAKTDATTVNIDSSCSAVNEIGDEKPGDLAEVSESSVKQSTVEKVTAGTPEPSTAGENHLVIVDAAVGNNECGSENPPSDQLSHAISEEDLPKNMVSQASQTEEEQTGWEASLAAPLESQVPLTTDSSTQPDPDILGPLPSNLTKSASGSSQPGGESTKVSRVVPGQSKVSQPVGQRPLVTKSEEQGVNVGLGKDASTTRVVLPRVGGRGRGIAGLSVGVVGSKSGSDVPGMRGSQRSEPEISKGRGRADIMRSRALPSRVVLGRTSLGGPSVGLAARSSPAVPASGPVPRLMRSRTIVEGTNSASSLWSVKRQSSTESAARTSRPSPSVMRQLRPTSGTPGGGVTSGRTNLSGLVRNVRTLGVHSSMNNIQSRSSWAVHHCGSSKLSEQQNPRGGRKSASNSSLHSSASSTSSASTVRSWADKVKGGPEALAKTSPRASQNLKEEAPSDIPSTEASKKPPAGDDDDSQGWETVRNRSSRSRISPASKVASLNANLLKTSSVENSGGLGSSLSQSAGNITKVLAKKDQKSGSLGMDTAAKEPARRSFPQTRFQRPSSATSLPALTSLGGNSKVHSPSPPKEGRPRANGKRSHHNSGNGKLNSLSKKVANLNNINNQKSNSKESSPDLKNLAIELSPVQDVEKRRKSKDIVIKGKREMLNEEKDTHNDISQKVEKMVNGTGNDEKNDDEDETKILEDLGKESPGGKSTESDSNLISDEVLRKTEELSAEEEKLEQEIMELEKTEIEVDTETEETETDGEACAGVGDEEDERMEVVTPEDRETIEAKYENMLAGMSWAERMEALEQLEAMAARHPGRALELHQKLSSPSRKRSLAETLRRYQAKQAQAEEKRQRLQALKATKLRELFKKIGEVREAKVQNIEAKREQLEQKLRRAEEKRKRHLQGIVRKAHDEEEKLKEIAFINELEAQNKRHDFMALCQEQEGRLLGIIEERQRKQEEKAAKEAAVEERRRALEAERQAKLEEMQERRRKREERIDREQQEKEKERLELAREKARDREERRSALQAAQLANQEELQRKIKQKQEESARRHDHNMELIRQRALALESCSLAGRGPGEDSSLPRLSPYETNKFCNLCNVLIESEVYLFSHLRGKKHQESLRSQTLQQKIGSDGHSIKESPSPINMCSMEHIVDAPADKIDPKIAQDRERQKALKKRCKKIRQRMSQKGQEYESNLEKSQKNIESSNKSRLQKLIKDVEKLSNSQGKGQWPDTAITALERALGEINRILDKQNVLDKIAFQALGGFTALTSIIEMALGNSPNVPQSLPPKCYITTCTTYNLACNGCSGNSKYVLLSNKITTVLDFLLQRLSGLVPFRGPVHGGSSASNKSTSGTPSVDPVAGALMRLLSLVLSSFASSPDLLAAGDRGGGGDGPSRSGAIDEQRIQDVICYAVSVGVVDKLASYCGGVRDPIDSDPAAAHFLLGAIGLISTLAACCASIRSPPKSAVRGPGGDCRVGRGGSASSSCSSSSSDPSDPTQLVSTLQATEVVGAASMLYGMLLHQGAPARSSHDAAASSTDASDEEGGSGASPLPASPVPPALPPHTIAVTMATFRLFTRVAELDLRMFQNVLGAEGISLQFRHIASYLLWYCSHHRERDLLHEVVRVVGFFAVGNHDNQAIIQSGYMPTVLQQLCILPFEYFSSPPLTKVLFPTLLACCRGNRQNRHILEREVSYQMLEDFRSSDDARDIVLVRLVSEQACDDADEDLDESFGDK